MVRPIYGSCRGWLPKRLGRLASLPLAGMRPEFKWDLDDTGYNPLPPVSSAAGVYALGPDRTGTLGVGGDAPTWEPEPLQYTRPAVAHARSPGVTSVTARCSRETADKDFGIFPAQRLPTFEGLVT